MIALCKWMCGGGGDVWGRGLGEISLEMYLGDRSYLNEELPQSTLYSVASAWMVGKLIMSPFAAPCCNEKQMYIFKQERVKMVNILPLEARGRILPYTS